MATARQRLEAYVKKHSISALMRELTESVILHRPEHPEQFLQEVLARQAQQQRDEAGQRKRSRVGAFFWSLGYASMLVRTFWRPAGAPAPRRWVEHSIAAL